MIGLGREISSGVLQSPVYNDGIWMKSVGDKKLREYVAH